MGRRLDWAQLTLVRLDQIELTIRVGIVPERDHLQWQIETRNPSTGELLAMSSAPHRRVKDCATLVAELSEVLEEVWAAHVLPF